MTAGSGKAMFAFSAIFAINSGSCIFTTGSIDNLIADSYENHAKKTN